MRLADSPQNRGRINQVGVLKSGPVVLQILQNLPALLSAGYSALRVIFRAGFTSDVPGHFHTKFSFTDQRKKVHRPIGDFFYIWLIGRNNILHIANPEHQSHGTSKSHPSAFRPGLPRQDQVAAAVNQPFCPNHLAS